jgi:hypothetical protein
VATPAAAEAEASVPEEAAVVAAAAAEVPVEAEAAAWASAAEDPAWAPSSPAAAAA